MVPWEYGLIGFTSWGHWGLAKDLLVLCAPSELLPPPSPNSALLQAQPQAPPLNPPTAAATLLTPPSPSSPGGAKNVGGFPASVWDLARQKLRVTSTPSHFEMDPWWQLLGEPSDVSISLSKEIARGSAGSP